MTFKRHWKYLHLTFLQTAKDKRLYIVCTRQSISSNKNSNNRISVNITNNPMDHKNNNCHKKSIEINKTISLEVRGCHYTHGNSPNNVTSDLQDHRRIVVMVVRIVWMVLVHVTIRQPPLRKPKNMPGHFVIERGRICSALRRRATSVLSSRTT